MALSSGSASVGLAGLGNLGLPRSGTPVSARPWSKDLAEVVQAARAADVPVPFAGWLAQTVAARVETHAHA